MLYLMSCPASGVYKSLVGTLFVSSAPEAYWYDPFTLLTIIPPNEWQTKIMGRSTALSSCAK